MVGIGVGRDRLISEFWAETAPGLAGGDSGADKAGAPQPTRVKRASNAGKKAASRKALVKFIETDPSRY